MNKTVKMILFGFLVWLIPFVVSIFFYTKDGKLLIDIFLFKSIMIVTGSINGAVLLILYFKKITKDYLKEGIIVGVSWLLISYVLDFAILLPMSKMSVGTYFTQIGLTYLAIPTMSITVGMVKNK